MSCNESKTVLRAEFPRLKGKSRNEAYPFYVKFLGEPIEVEEWNGEVDYFRYDGEYQPVYDYDSKRWGIDLVLHHESDYNTYIEMKTNGLTLDEFNKLANEMSLKFEVDKYKIRLISYSWYNGSDEPISFE
jgi:hypothetical protein